MDNITNKLQKTLFLDVNLHALKTRITILVAFLLSVASWAQPAEQLITRKEYIETYKDEAVREMLVNGIPASITLAQGILESDNGNSALARYANNHFGIKCHAGWNGPSFYQDDDAKDECFRKYYSAYRSYKDHSEFLRTRTRYASLFSLKPTDYKGWARGLKKAGYATNPKYADLLIKLIEENDLAQYDKVRKMPPIDKAEKEKKVEKIEKVEQKPSKSIVKTHENNINYVIAKQETAILKLPKKTKWVYGKS